MDDLKRAGPADDQCNNHIVKWIFICFMTKWYFIFVFHSWCIEHEEQSKVVFHTMHFQANTLNRALFDSHRCGIRYIPGFNILRLMRRSLLHVVISSSSALRSQLIPPDMLLESNQFCFHCQIVMINSMWDYIMIV